MSDEQMEPDFIKGDIEWTTKQRRVAPTAKVAPDLEALRASNEAERVRVAALVAPWCDLSIETRQQIASERIKCPVCKGYGSFRYSLMSEVPLNFGNSHSHNHFCPCKKVIITAQQLRKHIPQGSTHMIKMPSPSPKSIASIPFQQEVIDLLVSKPSASFALFGPAGTGKTSLSIWLYAQAIIRCFMREPWDLTGVMPMRASASALVRQHHAWITAKDDDDPDEPSITWQKASHNPCVFLAELEKIGPMTEYKYETLFTIIDTLYENRPQVHLVIDSNLTLDEFEAYFTDKISRRVAEMCYRIDYFDHTIKEPTEERMR
jgi:hypothetical protein